MRTFDPDLDERMRQYTVFCKTAMQMGWAKRWGRGRPQVSLLNIGAEHFRLTTNQCHLCKGRARDFLDEVDARNSARLKAVA